MKILGALLLTALTTPAFAQLGTHTCKEILEPTAFEVLRFRYTVEVKENQDISKSVAHADNAYAVSVKVGRETELGTAQETVKQFDAIGANEDVYYTISSVKKNGFKFYVYLDEEEEAGMTLIDENGQKTEVRLTCEYSENK